MVGEKRTIRSCQCSIMFFIYTGPIVTSSPMRRRRRVEFSARAAKNKWDALHKNVNAVINKKQTVANIEKDMDVWLKVCVETLLEQSIS